MVSNQCCREPFANDSGDLISGLLALGIVSAVIFLLGQGVKEHPHVRGWLRRLAERKSFQATPTFRNEWEVAVRDGLI